MRGHIQVKHTMEINWSHAHGGFLGGSSRPLFSVVLNSLKESFLFFNKRPKVRRIFPQLDCCSAYQCPHYCPVAMGYLSKFMCEKDHARECAHTHTQTQRGRERVNIETLFSFLIHGSLPSPDSAWLPTDHCFAHSHLKITCYNRSLDENENVHNLSFVN